jgi:hypothetical protein
MSLSLNEHKKIFAVLVLAVLLLLLCLAPVTIAPFPFSYWTKTFEGPQYIESVWPPPDSNLWRGYYGGMDVVFTPTREVALMERIPANGSPPATDLVDRLYLYVDNVQIPNTQRVVLEDNGMMLLTFPGVPAPDVDPNFIYLLVSGRYSVRWIPGLMTGKQIAKFVAETASGKKFEYMWSFEIK